MVSAKQAAESEFLTAEYIRSHQDLIVTIKDEGGYVEKTFGNDTKEKLELEVEIDGCVKKWCPNMRCSSAMMRIWGDDTVNWVGKKVLLRVIGKSTEAVPQ